MEENHRKLYSRKYSLKNPYLVLKYGSQIENDNVIVKYLTPGDLDSFSTIHNSLKDKLNSEDTCRICIIISNKFSKKASAKNKVRRSIAGEVKNYLLPKNVNGWFVFIPKKRLLNENGKITVDAKEISLGIDSLLSKMAVL